MKKSLLLLITGIFLLTGCGKKSDKVMTCTIKKNVGDIKIDSVYKATYNGEFVTHIKTKETLISDNANFITQYKKSIETKYSIYKSVKYYKYNVKVNGNTLVSTTDIDYSKIDTDKLIKIDSANKELIKDGKVLLSDVEHVYTQVGATCKK